MRSYLQDHAHFLLYLSSLILALSTLCNVNTLAAEADQTKIVASLTIANEDVAWKAAEQIGSEMKYAEIVKGMKKLLRSNMEEVDALNSFKPLGLVVATNGNEVFPFAYLPLKTDNSFNADKLNALKEKLNAQLPFLPLALSVKDSTLIITLEQFKDLIPTRIDLNKKLAKDDSGDLTLLELNIDLARIPQEFFEAAFSAFRQKLAEQLVDRSDDSAHSFEMLLEYYSAVFSSLNQFQTALLVNSSNDLVVRTTIVSKDGSVLSKSFTDLNTAQTRWASLTTAPKTLFASIASGKRLDTLKEYELYQFQNETCPNIFKQLDVLLDDSKDYEIAKRLVEILIAEKSASIDAGVFDVGFAMSSDPLTLKLGSNIVKSQELREAVSLIVERIKQENVDVDRYVQLDAAEIDGYSISKLDLPTSLFISEDSSITYFKNRSLAIRLGIGKDALALALGLDASAVDAEIANMIAGAQNLSTVPEQNSIDLGAFAGLLYEIGSQIENGDPKALAMLKAFADAEDAKIAAETQIEGSTLTYELRLEHGIFQAIGEIIRINLFGAKEDDSEELDDLFDDEE